MMLFQILGSTLASIRSLLMGAVEMLKNKINDLDSGKNIWDGQTTGEVLKLLK